jgi:hypothetical protein
VTLFGAIQLLHVVMLTRHNIPKSRPPSHSFKTQARMSLGILVAPRGGAGADCFINWPREGRAHNFNVALNERGQVVKMGGAGSSSASHLIAEAQKGIERRLQLIF